MDEKQIQNIARFRTVRPRWVGLGELVNRLFGPARQAKLGQVLRAQRAAENALRGDKCFKDHCCLSSVVDGTVVVEVDDPAMVDHCRRAYLFILRECLARQVPELGIRDIKFKAATGRRE